jgi:hypothetical protein
MVSDSESLKGPLLPVFNQMRPETENFVFGCQTLAICNLQAVFPNCCAVSKKHPTINAIKQAGIFLPHHNIAKQIDGQSQGFAFSIFLWNRANQYD